MASKQGDLYKKFYLAYKQIHHEISAQEAQRQTNEKWKEAKKNFPKFEELESHINELIEQYRTKMTKLKASRILQFFTIKTSDEIRHSKGVVTCTSSDIPTNTPQISNDNLNASESNTDPESVTNTSTKNTTNLSSNVDHDKDIECGNKIQSTNERKYSTPAQDLLKTKISVIESQLNAALIARDAGLTDDESAKNIKLLKKHLSEKKKSLLAIKKRSIRQQNFRKNFKLKVKRLCDENPKRTKELKIRTENRIGRPRIEDDQEEFLRVIAEIATFGASADPRRRTANVRSCKTLESMHKELLEMGFKCCKTTTYYRLMPRNRDTIEGKRHVKTVPVKLCRAQTDLHKEHPDQQFCAGTIRSLETLASILGPEEILFVSQDDKARVPIGITAANKQAPFLMNMEYRVRLPDHDWVVAGQHKLIPSVYAIINVSQNLLGKPEAVSYSGPTYVAIRSGKHSSSTAISHAEDFNKLLNIDSFSSFTRTSDGLVKPVVIITSDGGPDENPRYSKVILSAIDHFKKNDLDAIFIATNAPGRSAFNRVERRMAPLSKELSGVIIPHDHFGSHLDQNCKTIDETLEKRNFEYAGNLLAEIFNNVVLDSYAVYSEYICPVEQKQTEDELEEEDTEDISSPPSQSWYSQHVRESQYFLQVTKCSNQSCCLPFRSSLRLSLTSGFFPPPYPILHQPRVTIPLPKDALKLKPASLLTRLSLKLKPVCDKFQKIPYDFYCPTLQDVLCDRVCSDCSLYFATKKSLEEHKKIMHKKTTLRRSKIEPSSIVTRRRKEILCIIERNSGRGTTAEWRDMNDVDGPLNCSNVSLPTQSMQVINSIPEWLTSPWVEDDF